MSSNIATFDISASTGKPIHMSDYDTKRAEELLSVMRDMSTRGADHPEVQQKMREVVNG